MERCRSSRGGPRSTDDGPDEHTRGRHRHVFSPWSSRCPGSSSDVRSKCDDARRRESFGSHGRRGVSHSPSGASRPVDRQRRGVGTRPRRHRGRGPSSLVGPSGGGAIGGVLPVHRGHLVRHVDLWAVPGAGNGHRSNRSPAHRRRGGAARLIGDGGLRQPERGECSATPGPGDGRCRR